MFYLQRTDKTFDIARSIAGAAAVAMLTVMVCGCATAPNSAIEKRAPYEPELVFIRGGTFKMGSEKSGSGSEKPVRDVTISDFYMGRYEVTVSQFRAFVDATGYRADAEKGDGADVYVGGNWQKTRENWGKRSDANWRNPYFRQADNHPVACVSWNDATAFCEWLSTQTAKKYRLPTEAEWEYACRAGTTTRYSFGDSESRINRYAWYGDNSGGRTHEVGAKKPNPWGLYDMMGNIWEWTADWYDYYPHSNRPVKDPQGPSSGTLRVLRGGSWSTVPKNLRSADRRKRVPENTPSYIGFRVARDP